MPLLLVVKLKLIPWSVILLVISQRIRRLIARVYIFLCTNKAHVISLVGTEFDWIWWVTVTRSLQLGEPIKPFALQRDTRISSCKLVTDVSKKKKKKGSEMLRNLETKCRILSNFMIRSHPFHCMNCFLNLGNSAK